MKFLIQTINKKVTHDFSFTLIESCRYHNWLSKTNNIKIVFTDEKTKPNYIPIGSVEFVRNYLKTYHDIELKPINVPEELLPFQYSGRYIFNGTENDITDEKFVKSNDVIKLKRGDGGLFSGIYSKDDVLPKGKYQISDIIEIESEWRSFVYQNKLVGLQNYGGDFTKFPNISKIEKLISAYASAPIAYTLDVGVTGDMTYVIECHQFVSVGFYGFSNHQIIPFMFSKAFNEIIRKS